MAAAPVTLTSPSWAPAQIQTMCMWPLAETAAETAAEVRGSAVTAQSCVGSAQRLLARVTERGSRQALPESSVMNQAMTWTLRLRSSLATSYAGTRTAVLLTSMSPA